MLAVPYRSNLKLYAFANTCNIQSALEKHQIWLPTHGIANMQFDGFPGLRIVTGQSPFIGFLLVLSLPV